MPTCAIRGLHTQEQLLRCTSAKVYVLIRGKRGASTSERLQRLLSKPLFAKHMSDRAAEEDTAARVVAVHGDIQASGLGMANDILELMQREVHFFIHAAADVALDRPLQASLRCNYCSTAAVLEVAGSMCSLRSFVYVSSAFVSVHLARGSVVQEQLYGLLGPSKQNGHTAYVSGTTHQLLHGRAASDSSRPVVMLAEQLLALSRIQASGFSIAPAANVLYGSCIAKRCVCKAVPVSTQYIVQLFGVHCRAR